MAAPEKKFARLKRYNPRLRHVLRSYAIAPCDLAPAGQRFEEKRGWHPVTDEVAAYLATIHQVETDLTSPLAFDICTLAQAKAIDREEKAAADRRAGHVAENDLPGEEVPRAAAVVVPKAQRGIRGGVRDPRERSMRPADEA